MTMLFWRHSHQPIEMLVESSRRLFKEFQAAAAEARKAAEIAIDAAVSQRDTAKSLAREDNDARTQD